MVSFVVALVGLSSLTLVDRECRTYSEGAKGIAAEVVDLGKAEKPYRCAAAAAGKSTCLSSRSGKSSDFQVEREDARQLVLRYLGAGEWTAVIRVDVKAGRFQTASSWPSEAKGLVSEFCTGTATYAK